MATQTTLTYAVRIGKFKGAVLKHAMPQEVIGRLGASVKVAIPKNSSETVEFLRWLPKGASTTNPNTWSVDPATHRLTEGETPNAETLAVQKIQATLKEFGVLYSYTNRTADFIEDDVPAAMRQMVGERMGMVLEQERWGILKGGTNVFRAGGVSSRASITGLISANMLRNVARNLSHNLASKITGILAPSVNVATQPVEAAFVAICDTDLEADIRSQLTGFVHISEYGQRKPLHENELGSWEQFRFVTSPHLAPYLAAGGTTTANTRLTNGVANSAGSENVDVYPMVVLGEQAYADVRLRGDGNGDVPGLDVTMIPAGQKTKDDPLGQRGYVGAKVYYTAVRLNEQHMAVCEMACSYLA